MLQEEFRKRNFEAELVFSASRSSGAGGQNVNKVNSKVELRFAVETSMILSTEERIILLEKLKNKINQNGELILTAQTDRSQFRNKEIVINNFYVLIAKALTKRKKRKPTKPSFGSVEKRLKTKKGNAANKALRGKIDI